MATIRNGSISTSFKYVKINNVEREYSDEVTSVAPSVSSSGASAKSRYERKKNISRSEGCFITKQTGWHLEMAHWVNAVRGDDKKKLQAEVVRLMISSLRTC